MFVRRVVSFSVTFCVWRLQVARWRWWQRWWESLLLSAEVTAGRYCLFCCCPNMIDNRGNVPDGRFCRCPQPQRSPSVWLRLRAAPHWLIYQLLHQMWENNRSEKFSPAQQQWKEEKPLCTDGGILISDLIDTSELKPEGKLFHTFRNVVSKPRLNSLTNFQQHCLKRRKHCWELQPIKKKKSNRTSIFPNLYPYRC